MESAPRFRSFPIAPLLALLAAPLAACGGSSETPPPATQPPPACSVEAQTGCEAGRVCEQVEGGATACFAPVTVSGRVVRSDAPDTGIEGARVVARDASGALVSRSAAVSGKDGAYSLVVPAERAADGTPRSSAFTLRADASGFATFPGGLRVALPVDASAAIRGENGAYGLSNAGTDVALDALADATARGTVSGQVKPAGAGGALIVAGGATGVADADGRFVVFDVPAGSQEIRGYAAGLQLAPATADVKAGAETTDVALVADPGALATVSGDVSFVDASSSETSVVLVVASTFDQALARGEVPRGLRADVGQDKWSIAGVPSGEYVVLAAFEDDGLVRDPDATIAGTAVLHVTVANAPVTVPAFKITGALDVVSPGTNGPEPVGGTPSFTWKDDASENGYELRVYDRFGQIVWSDENVPSVTGAGNVTVAYGGPALAPGYYQFRAWSWRDKKGARSYISSTEDLKGVFVAP